MWKAFRPTMRLSLSKEMYGKTAIYNKRFHSKSSKPPAKKQEGLKFHYIVLVAALSYVALTQAVKNMDKNRAKNEFSEEEYNQLQDGLKRKVKAFPDDQNVQVSLLPRNLEIPDLAVVSKTVPKDVNIINIQDLVETEKSNPKSKYGPLIKECESFEKPIPTGTKTSLVGAKIEEIVKKNNDQKTFKFLIVGFPDSILESIKFEEKIVTAKQLIDFNTQEELDAGKNDVVNYFKTVQKVQFVQTLDDLKKIVN